MVPHREDQPTVSGRVNLQSFHLISGPGAKSAAMGSGHLMREFRSWPEQFRKFQEWMYSLKHGAPSSLTSNGSRTRDRDMQFMPVFVVVSWWYTQLWRTSREMTSMK